MELIEMMQNRRSVRKYTGEPLPADCLEKILQAGLLPASGRGLRPWQLIVVQAPETLAQLAGTRAMGAGMLMGAAAAIVVLGDETASDTWTEDCSIVMANMHLMADALGVGSCWIQGRLRTAPDGSSTEAAVRQLLGFPEQYRLEAILSLGMPESHPPRRELSDLPTEKIHYEKF